MGESYMSITKRFFGTADGKEVNIFTLTNSKGMKAEIANYGGVVVSLFVPDKDGKLEDVVLGFDNLQSYTEKGPYLGALIGRFGNRIENASFELNGIVYNLAKNDGNNHLHGGLKGFDKVVWDAEIVDDAGEQSLVLTYLSKDGEENYPGNLSTKVTYKVTEENELYIGYFAVTDKDTVINLTNHSYFNLSGHASGDILGHELMLNSDSFTVANNESIPTGEIKSVEGTPMDFKALTKIGTRINDDFDQLVFAGGYDHNWVLKVSGKAPEKAGEVYDPASGRIMEVYTTKPGVQFYAGNFLDGTKIGKGGTAYNKRAGLCLETQYYPNSIKHKHFPSPILKAGEEYKHVTIYRFSSK
jgi:aldose 1-epimerase